MEPTNEEIRQMFAEHTKHDEAFQDETRKVHAEQLIFKAETEGQLASLEKKIDALIRNTEDIKLFMKNVKIGEGILKFSWNNMSKIGGTITFIIGVYLFLKFGFVGLVALLFGGGLPK